MRYALLGPACAFVLGAALGQGVDVGVVEAALGAMVLSGLGIIAGWQRKKGWTLACFSVAIGVAGAGYAAWRRPAPPEQAPFMVNEVSLFDGCVVGATTGAAGALRVTVEVGGGSKMNLSQGRAAERFEYGERIRFRATPRTPRSFQNPGSFDYRAWLAARGIYWQARLAPGTGIERLQGRCGGRVQGVVEGMRSGALKRIDALYAGDDYRKAMMKGLLLGEASEIRRAWVEGFRQTGTYHALVISGSHVAFVAGVFLLYLRRFRYGETTVLLVACLTAWTYALVAGGEPPVTRTAAGFTLAMVARWHSRRVSLLHILAVVAVVFVALEPWQVAEAGFQLSFMAVAAIGAVAMPWTADYVAPAAKAAAALKEKGAKAVNGPAAEAWLVELKLASETLSLASGWTDRRCRLWLGWAMGTAVVALELFAVSAAIQLALALPMVLYFHRLSLTGLSANVLATPVITMAIPAGFLAVMTGWGWAAAVAACLLDAGTKIVAWHGAWEPYWRMPDPPVWLALALAASTAALGVALVGRRWRMAAFGLTVGLLGVTVVHPFEPRVERGFLELAAIDVGQAESLHLGLPDGRSMLVDTGGFAGPAGQQRTRLDPGEDVVSPYLWQRGVKRLEVVAISHFHSDHCGGLRAVMRNFRPRELWAGRIPGNMRVEVEGWARGAGTRIRQWKRGEKAMLGGVEFEALTGLGGSSEGAAKNNDSLVLRARYGRHGFLLTGDIEKSVERELVDAGGELKADVLKVAHHGSARSNLDEFLDAARPAVALISAAGSDWMRLPSEKVVAALRQRRALVLRTDQDGLVWVRSDGRRLEPGALRWMPGGWARLDPF